MMPAPTPRRDGGQAFYNEHDSKAAAWLRELIAEGHIAPGVVDERDIQNINGDELATFTQVHFFAGIGGWSLALRLAGWPDDRHVWTGSCPCQPFSAAGKRKGTDDARHLWPDMRRLVSECHPSTVFGEQVASKDGRNWLAGVRADLEALGFAVGAADLCAASAGPEGEGWFLRGDRVTRERIAIGAPHIRQRLWWMAHAQCPGVRLPGCGADPRAPGRVQGEDGERERLRTDVGSVRDLEHRGLGDARRESARRYDGPGFDRSEACGIESAGVGEAPTELAGASATRGVGDSASERRGEARRTEADRGATEMPPGAGPVGGMAEPKHGTGRILGHVSEAASQDEGASPGQGDGNAAEHCRAVRRADFWSAFELVPCRDGKTRRVEPGTFPLADGLPGRVGLLRGFGNAIVPQVAAEFILAAMETGEVSHAS